MTAIIFHTVCVNNAVDRRRLQLIVFILKLFVLQYISPLQIPASKRSRIILHLSLITK